MRFRTVLSLGLLFVASIANARPFLSERFEDELGTQEWRRVFEQPRAEWYAPPTGQPLPIRLLLRDEEIGREISLDPAVVYEVDGRVRWGGRALDIDWVLILDGLLARQEDLTATLQLKAAEPRSVSVSIGVSAELEHARWHRDFFSVQDLERASGEITTSRPAPYGAEGRMAVWPLGVLQLPTRLLVAAVNPSEPRIFQIVARPADRFFGVRYHAFLSPQTTAFPGRAVFQCQFSSWAGLTNVSGFRQAVARWASRATASPEDDPLAAPTGSFPLVRASAARVPVHPEWSHWWPFARRAVDSVVLDEQTNEQMIPENVDLQQARMRAGNRPIKLRYHPAIESNALHAALYWGMLPEAESEEIGRVYAPIRSMAARLARSGWQVAGPITARESGISIEHFGPPDSPVRQVTLFNQNPWPVHVTLEMPGEQGLWLLADPRRGGLELSSAETAHPTWTVLLPARAVETRDYFALPDLHRARALYASAALEFDEVRLLQANIDSLAQELDLDIMARVRFPALTETQVWAEFSNAGTQTVIVSDAVLSSDSRRTSFIDEPFSLRPGQRRAIDAYLADEPDRPAVARVQWRLSGIATSVWAERCQRIVLLAPLVGWCDLARVATADDAIEIPIRVFNLSDRPRTVRARLERSRGSSFSPVLVAARSDTLLMVRIPRDPPPTRNPVAIELTSHGAPFFRHECTVDFLSDDDSLARDSRVRIETSSTRQGYSRAALADGLTRMNPANPWNTSWCSEDVATPHAVRMRFPQPTAISEVRLHWPEMGGSFQTARMIRLLGRSSDGRLIELARATPSEPSDVTVLAFESIQVEEIELQMPAGGGASTSPNLLWLCEMEVR